MNFPTLSMGLPQSLKYDLPPSFSDSARAYSVNVAPDGITQVTGPTSTIPCAADGGTQIGAFNSQMDDYQNCFFCQNQKGDFLSDQICGDQKRVSANVTGM